MHTALRFPATLVLAALLACVSCGEQSVDDRTVRADAEGYSFVIPPVWMYFGDDSRSTHGTVFTVEILSLVDGDPTFLAELPRSIVPQLATRTQYFFDVVAPHKDEDVTIDGLPALHVNFPVHVRKEDHPSRLDYWIVRNGDQLFILHATYPPDAPEEDAREIESIIASWKFTPIAGADAGGEPATTVIVK